MTSGVVTPKAVTRPYAGARGPSEAAYVSRSHVSDDRTCAPPGRQVVSRPLQHGHPPDRPPACPAAAGPPPGGAGGRGAVGVGHERADGVPGARRPYEQAPERGDRLAADPLEL